MIVVVYVTEVMSSVVLFPNIFERNLCGGQHQLHVYIEDETGTSKLLRLYAKAVYGEHSRNDPKTYCSSSLGTHGGSTGDLF